MNPLSYDLTFNCFVDKSVKKSVMSPKNFQEACKFANKLITAIIDKLDSRRKFIQKF